jgi:Polyketide cyclase / dehydrase and lipid transport
VTVDVSTEVVIQRARDEVAVFASNPDNVPKWYANIKTVEWKTSPPLRIGSQVAFVAQFLGRRLAYTYEVVEWIPNERFVMRTAEGPFPMETTYTWTTASNGTRMTLSNRGTPTGFSKLFAPFMGMAVRRANRKDLKALKEFLEHRR